MDCWKILGIDATGDVREIRRAYAVKLKALGFQAETLAFQGLRSAYEEALATATCGMREAETASESDSTPSNEDGRTLPPYTIGLDSRPTPKSPFAAEMSPDSVNMDPATNQQETTADHEPGPRPDESVLDGYRLEGGDDGDPVATLADEACSSVASATELFAPDRLREYLARPELLSLSDRERFEQFLLQRVFENLPIQWRLLDVATEVFRWDESLWPLTEFSPYLAGRAARQIDFRRRLSEEDRRLVSDALSGYGRRAEQKREPVPLARYVATLVRFEQLAGDYSQELRERVGTDPADFMVWWRAHEVIGPDRGVNEPPSGAAENPSEKRDAVPEGEKSRLRTAMDIVREFCTPWWMILLIPVMLPVAILTVVDKQLGEKSKAYRSIAKQLARFEKYMTPRWIVIAAIVLTIVRCTVELGRQ